MRELISRRDALMEARPEYLNPQQQKLASYNQGWNDAVEEYYDGIRSLPSEEPRYMGCHGCVHYDQQQTLLICRDCKRSYRDMYEDGEEE